MSRRNQKKVKQIKRDERRFKNLQAHSVQTRQGVVSSKTATQLKVKLGGSAVEVIAQAIDGNVYDVGDRVACIQWKGDLLILGKPTGEPKSRPILHIPSTGFGLLGVTDAYQDVPGLTYTTPSSGVHDYLVRVYLDIEATALGTGTGDITSQLLADGAAQSGVAVYKTPTANARYTISYEWYVEDLGASKVLKIQTKKANNQGTVNVYGPTQSKMIVERTG